MDFDIILTAVQWPNKEEVGPDHEWTLTCNGSAVETGCAGTRIRAFAQAVTAWQKYHAMVFPEMTMSSDGTFN